MTHIETRAPVWRRFLCVLRGRHRYEYNGYVGPSGNSRLEVKCPNCSDQRLLLEM